MLTREQLKVGEKYKNKGDGVLREILFIGNESLFYRSPWIEHSISIEHFLENSEIVPNESDIVELYKCFYMSSSTVSYLTKDKKRYRIKTRQLILVDFLDEVIFLSDKPEYRINIKTGEVLK